MLHRRTNFEVRRPFRSIDMIHFRSQQKLTLNFDVLTLKPVHSIIARGMANLPTNFGVSGTFRSRLMSQHMSDAPRDIATLTFDLGDDGASRRYRC